MDRDILTAVTNAVRTRDHAKAERASVEHHVEHAIAEALAARITKASIARAIGWSQQRLHAYISRHREDIEEMRATCARLQAIFAGMKRHKALLERAVGIRSWWNRRHYRLAEIEARRAKRNRLLDTARHAVGNRATNTEEMRSADHRVTLALVAAYEAGATQVAIADAAGWGADRVRKRLNRYSSL